jgi:hypothetical protein
MRKESVESAAAVEPVRAPREPAKPFTFDLPSDAGIQMMETTSNAAVASAPEPTQPRGRARPQRKALEDAPMQMVETSGAQQQQAQQQ